MARRGDKLREHILWTAKSVFQEMGFERASMDVVAARAETSKRSLYAHFESKEKLFLASVERVRGRFLEEIGSPEDYSGKPVDALTHFCGRFLEILLHQGAIRMCRVCIAEAERFPEGAAAYFDLLFTQVEARVSVYLRTTFRLPPKVSADAANGLLGQLLYPAFPRALFGIDALVEDFHDEGLSPDFDLRPVRRAVQALISSLED
ncbi:TetR/AcrR family transcriptional regulator [Silvibacterium sp.]|uniref:TetR/AcrR family transcriptional regulator n=1 Tax=Silvibacterium sp. TaxID=1964179 RepID=UPI0039E672F3